MKQIFPSDANVEISQTRTLFSCQRGGGTQLPNTHVLMFRSEPGNKGQFCHHFYQAFAECSAHAQQRDNICEHHTGTEMMTVHNSLSDLNLQIQILMFFYINSSFRKYISCKNALISKRNSSTSCLGVLINKYCQAMV